MFSFAERVMPPEDGNHYFRYDGYEYAAPEPYKVIRRTEKGVWIDLGYGSGEKFILDGARKRWAYPTLEEAKESFRIRKLRQIEHCRRFEKLAAEALDKVGFDSNDELKRFFREDEEFML